MSWDETSVYEGTQSQTGLSRWGDYSCMSVDPANDHDFWFTTEYSNGGWNWRTRIASFSPVPVPAPVIVVTPDSLEFGNIVPGNPASNIITVQNTGNAQLLVDEVFSDNQDFIVNPDFLTVESGEQAAISVDFFPSSAGLKKGIISISSNDPANPELTVAVSGTGVLPAPENLKAEVIDHSVSLTWQAAQISVKGFLGYNIYRQENLINLEPVSGTDFTETNVPGGEWLYQVAAAYNEGLSELTPPVTVVVGNPQIWTNISSVSDILISGDSLIHQIILKNTGDLPLNFEMDVNFDFKNLKSPTAGFCVPNSNCNSGRRLDVFTLAEINNTSSGCSPSGYGDFTYLTGNLEAGTIYTAGFKGGISKMYVCLWIDFNENEEFETDEILVNDLYLKYASVTYTQEITLPTFVNSGQKRLRVRCNYNASAADPCSDFTNGETEDYTVELKDGQDAWLTVNPLSANVLPGDSVFVDLKLNASRLEKAVYSARIGVASNDPDNSYFEIPVAMNVLYILAKFGADSVNLLTGDSTGFFDYSLGNPTTWFWEFEGGNPSTSTDSNPVGIKYMETGVFDVSLMVSNGLDTSYLLKQDLITVLPGEVLHAEFISDFTVVNEGGAVHFFDNSTGNPDFYKWEIPGGNPEIIYIQNPIIIFNTPGFYDVTLYISGDSMSDQITKYDYIEVLEVVSTLPPEWDFTTTIHQHILVVPTIADPRIIDTPLNPGDYIGVFYTNSFGQKACGGATMWTGQEGVAVVAQGDDPFTPFKDGFAVGESFEWRLYSWSRERDFIAVPHYDPALLSTGVFYPMGMSALTNLYSGITFTLTILQGWNGISLPVDPWYPEMDVLLEPIMENLVMIYNNSGVFWPENNINTLGNWNVLSGYVIKSLQPDTVVVEGYKEKNLIRGLAPGWNYLSIPVLCDKNVVDLFASNFSKLGLIREIAGLNMYWPQFNINTLGTVKPGKAYHVYVNQAFNLPFSECTLAPQAPVSDDVEQVSIPENPWNFTHFTGNIHSIAFSQSSTTNFVAGDIVGVFDASGNCCGIAGFDGRPFAVNVFGDDATTREKDGFLENENMVFKMYRTESQDVFELYPVFDPTLQDGGAFITNGLSAITEFKLSLGVNNQISAAEITIFPNPADGKFKISGIATIEKIYVLDMQGREILQAGNDGKESLTIDFTGNSRGVYFLRMVSKHNVFVKRIVVK